MYVRQYKINGEWVDAASLHFREMLVCDGGCGRPIEPGQQAALRLESARGTSNLPVNANGNRLFQIHEECLPQLLDRLAPRPTDEL